MDKDKNKTWGVDWEELYGKIGSHPGSWSVLGIPLPDFGKTEELQKAVFPNTAVSGDERGSNLLGSGALTPVKENDIRNISGTEREWAALNNKGQMMNTGTGEIGRDTARILAQLSSGVNTDTDTKDKTNTSGTPTPKDDTYLEDLIAENEREKLEKQREDQLAIIRANLASGRRYYNDAFSGLERKRGEFQQRHDDDLDDLMTTYGGDIADLQATAEGSDARLANAALAQGISGSGLDELLRRNEVSKQRQLGTARETRQSNERANTAALNENFNWALGQEEAINRAREDLESQARLAENTTWSNFQNTLGDLITQSLANKQALQASGLGVGNYQNLAADLLGSGIDTGALTNAFNSTMGATQNNSQSINPQYANMSLLDQEKRQKGLIV